MDHPLVYPYKITFLRGLMERSHRHQTEIVQAFSAADAITQFNADANHSGGTGLGRHAIIKVEPYIPPED